MELSTDDFRSIHLPFPSQSEQLLIADYLDRETTQIDNLIAAKEQMLTLLEEKREALISHAVTRGLDPNVAFKRSGLDWLGDIPQHWNIIRLRHLAKEALAYGANEAALEDNPSYPRFIRITDIRDDGSLRPETFKSLSPEVAKPYLLNDGDVLLARSGATVGKAFIYRKEWGTACFAGYLIRCRCNKELLIPSFLFYYTQSSSYWSQVYAGTIQATIQNFSGEKYGDIFIPIPPLSEQKDILNFLDYETSKLDGLLAAIKESIALLKERRSALITAAVTGQIALEDMKS
jgi:restriction endonuclease S subunit